MADVQEGAEHKMNKKWNLLFYLFEKGNVIHHAKLYKYRRERGGSAEYREFFVV